MLDCAVTAVTDDLIPQGVGTSCYSTYSHALLLGLADPCAMSVRQIELADRWLGQWAASCFRTRDERESEGPVVVVDLDSTAGARLVPAAPHDAPASFRFGYPGKLATSVRGRLKRLHRRRQRRPSCSSARTSPPSSASRSSSHLEARWYQVPRGPGEGEDAELDMSRAARSPRTSVSADARSTARIRSGARSRKRSI